MLVACSPQVFELAQFKKAPIALAVVQCIDALFAIDGTAPKHRLAVRAARSAPCVRPFRYLL